MTLKPKSGIKKVVREKREKKSVIKVISKEQIAHGLASKIMKTGGSDFQPTYTDFVRNKNGDLMLRVSTPWWTKYGVPIWEGGNAVEVEKVINTYLRNNFPKATLSARINSPSFGGKPIGGDVIFSFWNLNVEEI